MKKRYLKLVFLTLFTSAASAQVYVTPTGGGTKDGSSWANAFEGTQLQQAINLSVGGTQVWVAKGTYKPTESLSTTGFLTDGSTAVTDRDKTFILKAGVEIYGGFDGTEVFGAAAIAARNFTTNETILSGDLNDTNAADVGDAYHVVSSRNASLGAVLDGFTIQHGFANGTGSVTVGGVDVFQNVAGGVHLIGDQTGGTFRKLIVQLNQAVSYAGGILARGADGFSFSDIHFKNNISLVAGGGIVTYATTANGMSLSNCTFTDNEGKVEGGGGLAHDGDPGAVINISNCTFTTNKADKFGGAFRLNKGTANITGSTFTGNTALLTAAKGGAIFNTGGSTLNINTTMFTNNKSLQGGHLYIENSTVYLTNSTLKTGNATSGGAIFQLGTSVLIGDNVMFDANTGSTGGHYYLNSGTGNFTKSTFKNASVTGNGAAFFASATATSFEASFTKFYSNTAAGTSGGGAIYAQMNMKFENCDFRSNTTAAHGGAIFMTSSSSKPTDVKIINSSFYNNVANGNGDLVQGGGALVVTFSTSTTKLTAINNTFYANKSPNSIHGAITLNADVKVSVNLYNNIFNGNTGKTAASADLRKTATPVLDFQNNLFQTPIVTSSGDDTFTDNIVNDAPASLFASTTDGDFNFLYPTSTSVVIEQGNNALYSTLGNIGTDKHLAGYARLAGTNIDMGAVEYASVLPVTIKTFTAKLANNRTQLRWTVGTEDNVSHYEIERSQNGTDFTKIAEAKATSANAYSVTDANPQIGVNYYRLKTIDNDAKSSYYGSLQTVTLNALASAGVKVYPNPVKGNQINLAMGDLAAGTYQYKLINSSGGVAQQGMVSYDGNKNISLATTLPAGLYVMHFGNGSVKVAVKLIKQ